MKKYEVSLLIGFKMNENDIAFLTTVGVPEEEILLINFFDVPDWFDESKRYLSIGKESYGGDLCIEIATRNVFLKDKETLSKIFVNANIEDFIVSILEYKRVNELRYGTSEHRQFLDDEINRSIVSEFERYISEKDKKANCESTYWPVILEQMYNQFL